MATVYHTRPAVTAAQAGALVVHCSDPRYQPHFQDFLRHGLGLTGYGLIAVPGGPQLLTNLPSLPKFPWVGWRWTEFMVELMRPERLILIAHDDCRWYFTLPFARSPERVQERQISDLRAVRDEINERFAVPRVELYYAHLRDDQASFETL